MSDKKWLWHRRLGHANWRLISKRSKLQLVRGLPDIDYYSDALCGACQKGKIVKTSFKSKDILFGNSNQPMQRWSVCSSIQIYQGASEEVQA